MLEGTQEERQLPTEPVVVGLDVHKRSISVAVRAGGAVIRQGVVTSPDALLAQLARYRRGLVAVVYEAGPTGFGLARALQAAGMPVMVVAPSRMPRPVGRGNKSDRLDCLLLAEYAEKGLLRPVAIPMEREEQDRQLIRLRFQMMENQRRTKQRIRSFLLYHGIAEPLALGNWSQRAVRQLERMPLPEMLRIELDLYLTELTHAREMVRHIEEGLRELAKTPRYAEAMAYLTSHPGVGPTTAMAFLLEIFDPARFINTRQVSAYLGLAPGVRQSGERRREGPLLPAGRGDLRALLVEAAWQWIRRDAPARKVYERLRTNTGCSQKAIVAMARRMAIHLWTMAIRKESYRPAA